MKGQIKALIFLPLTRLRIIPPGIETDTGCGEMKPHQRDCRSQSLGELHAVDRFSCVHLIVIDAFRVKAADPNCQWPLRLRS